jgi:hypothetical protein
MPDIPLIVEIDAEDQQCAIVFVDACVADQTYRFILDTGASRTQVVADDFIDTLETIGEHRSRGVFALSSQRTVLIPNIAIGPLEGGAIEASVAPRSESVHPLIGMDLLSRHRLHFLFDREVLVIDESPLDFVSISLALDESNHLYLVASWPTATANCVWDSGAGMSIVDEAFWSKNRGLFTTVEDSIGVDASGAQRSSTTYEVSGMALGGRQFAPHHVAVVDLSAANSTLATPMDMILGYPTLRQYNWFFDVPQRLWSITERDNMSLNVG